MGNNKLIVLREFITEHYNLDELHTLCFDLGIDYDELAGRGKSAKVRELLLWVDKQEQYNELLSLLYKSRTVPFQTAGLATDKVFIHQLHDQSQSFNLSRKAFHRRLAVLSLVLVLILFLTFYLREPSFLTCGKPPTDLKHDDEMQLLSIIDTEEEAIIGRDISHIMAFFGKDAIVRDVRKDRTSMGCNAIQERYNLLLKELAVVSWEHEINTLQISEDKATAIIKVYAEYEAGYGFYDNELSQISMEAQEIWVFVKVNDLWKIQSITHGISQRCGIGGEISTNGWGEPCGG